MSTPDVQTDSDDLSINAASPFQAAATPVRVGTERLDDLVAPIGEPVVAHSRVSQSNEALEDPTSSFAKNVARQQDRP